MRVIDASSIRKKIIEHLATTVNGSLAELGYFPGTLQKLQQLEHEAARGYQYMCACAAFN